MEPFITYFSAAFFVLTLLAAFVLPSIRTYRQTGIHPIAFGKVDNAHHYIGKCFKLLLGLLPVCIIGNWAGGSLYAFYLPAVYLEHGPVQGTGVALCLASLLWIVTAQGQMGTSWRIGIDKQHRTALVTEGLFSLSRNPIFLGMQVCLLGFFLLLPSALTLLVLVSGSMLIRIQVRLEEAFLAKQHGTAYMRYKERVPRFI